MLEACPYCIELEATQTNLEDENAPPKGYCAWCQSCERPGHVRQYPGSVPYSGSWCDDCYSKLLQNSTGISVVRLLFLGFFIFLPIAFAAYQILRNFV